MLRVAQFEFSLTAGSRGFGDLEGRWLVYLFRIHLGSLGSSGDLSVNVGFEQIFQVIINSSSYKIV